jgi:hypothetical protein
VYSEGGVHITLQVLGGADGRSTCSTRWVFNTSGLGYLLALRTAALFDSKSDWTQRLWRYGTVAQLRELLGLAENRATVGAKTYALNSARRMLERDPVIIGPKRGLIIRCLPRPADIERFVLNSSSYRILLQAVDSLDQEYLRLWIDQINARGEATDIGNANLNVDLCGMLIGSHLRSSGLSETWIINHLQYELKRKQSASSMINVLEVADRITRKGEGPYSFLVPLRESAHINSKVGMPWLSRKDFTARFSELFPGKYSEVAW